MAALEIVERDEDVHVALDFVGRSVPLLAALDALSVNIPPNSI